MGFDVATQSFGGAKATRLSHPAVILIGVSPQKEKILVIRNVRSSFSVYIPLVSCPIVHCPIMSVGKE